MDDQKQSFELIKTKDLSDQTGLFFGDNCVIPSKNQADHFCDGMMKALDTAIELTGADRKNFQIRCNPTAKMPETLPKELADTKDPQAIEIFQDQLITLDRIDPDTKSVEKSNPFIAQRMEGTISEEQCIIPKEIVMAKFCSGFNEGLDAFFRFSKLDRKKYRSNCKTEQGAKEQGTKNRILYGLMRTFEG